MLQDFLFNKFFLYTFKSKLNHIITTMFYIIQKIQTIFQLIKVIQCQFFYEFLEITF